MDKSSRLLIGLSVVLGIASANAGTYTISTSLNQLQAGVDNQGWLAETFGNNNPTNDNYFTGHFYVGGEHRSFFSFDLSGVSGTVTSATFNVRRYDQSLTSLSIGLFDVSTPASTLITTRQGLINPTVFADLGSGNGYGSFVVNNGLSTDILSFSLNANALTDINAVVGSGYFSIGAALLTQYQIMFGASNDEPGNSGKTLNSIQELVLTTATVPEPSSIALSSISAAALMINRWRKYSAL